MTGRMNGVVGDLRVASSDEEGFFAPCNRLGVEAPLARHHHHNTHQHGHRQADDAKNETKPTHDRFAVKGAMTAVDRRGRSNKCYCSVLEMFRCEHRNDGKTLEYVNTYTCIRLHTVLHVTRVVICMYMLYQ